MKPRDRLGKRMLNLMAAAFLVAGTSVSTEVQGNQKLSTLNSITTGGTSTEIVIHLSATGPIRGELQSLDDPTTRLYLDLPNTVPAVPSVTDVNFGAVIRVRVALNQLSPPLTRVVIDVEDLASYELVPGLTERELRIVVRKEQNQTKELKINNLEWHTKKIEQLKQLLELTSSKYSDGTINVAEQQQLEVEWALKQMELVTITPSTKFERLHELLLTTCLIGNAVTKTLGDPLFTTDIASALAGAFMFLREADQLVNTLSDNVF